MGDDGPPLDSIPEEELVDALADEFHAQDLREWMSANDLSRPRGANKRESAEAAVEQERGGVARFLYDRGAIEVDWERRCMYHEACGNHTDSPREDVCTECLDYSRRNSSEGAVDIGDFEDRTAYMAELHARFG